MTTAFIRSLDCRHTSPATEAIIYYKCPGASVGIQTEETKYANCSSWIH